MTSNDVQWCKWGFESPRAQHIALNTVTKDEQVPLQLWFWRISLWKHFFWTNVVVERVSNAGSSRPYSPGEFLRSIRVKESSRRHGIVEEGQKMTHAHTVNAIVAVFGRRNSWYSCRSVAGAACTGINDSGQTLFFPAFLHIYAYLYKFALTMFFSVEFFQMQNVQFVSSPWGELNPSTSAGLVGEEWKEASVGKLFNTCDDKFGKDR